MRTHAQASNMLYFVVVRDIGTMLFFVHSYNVVNMVRCFPPSCLQHIGVGERSLGQADSAQVSLEQSCSLRKQFQDRKGEADRYVHYTLIHY